MASALNHYRLLGRSGLRVSPLCLGTMTFGKEWGWGSDKDESRTVFDAFTEQGGNFIDTANFYTNGTSETFLGEFLRDRRDQFVLATKFTLATRPGDPNASGNHRKNLHQALEASLRRLRTDYIDLYWLHIWDGRTPVDETMRALDDAVRAGKVLYIGVSDMPAWKVAQSNTLAELRGWSRYVGLQIEYSLVERTVERDLIPMARELGLGVTPWSPLGGGVLTGKYSKSGSGKTGTSPARYQTQGTEDWAKAKLTERNHAIAAEVAKVGGELGASPAQVSLAWLLAQPGVTSLIIGARNTRQLNDNIGSLRVTLSPDHVARLDQVSRIELGFPHDFIASPATQQITTSGTVIV